MTLSVIIVSYNTQALLRECLQSLLDHAPAAAEMSLVVVDNASHDGSPEMVSAEFPQVRLIANDANTGYAAAVNQGLREQDADYVLVLNSDIEAKAGSLDALLVFMETHPAAGMAGPLLVLPGGQPQRTWEQGFTLKTYARQQLLLDMLGRRMRAGETPAPRLEEDSDCRAGACTPPSAHEVEHLHGAALIVRRSALAAVGPLDEGYFMYCEDSDWCLRFIRAGWKLYLVPASRMLHHHGASSRNIRAEMIANYNLAAARYFRLHYGPLEGLVARWLGLTGVSLRFFGTALGTVLTLGLYEPLRRRAWLFFRVLDLMARRKRLSL